METKMLTLTPETLNAITSEIEHTELEDGWSEGYELELKQGSCLIIVTYRALGEYVREYDYHSEVDYNCYENLSHTDFIDAEITNIEARDDDDELVSIANLNEIEYYN